MISVCIPVYNRDVTEMVVELASQADIINIPYEIVLIDDSSSPETRNINDTVCRNHRYILLEDNVGRSRIRNMFMDYTGYENLLFLDCDSGIISKAFLKKYINEISANEYGVLYGGMICDRKPPRRAYRLRWKYSLSRECVPSEVRNSEPYRYFKTNNFLINKKVLQEIRFDERLINYGYEDTLFGYNLRKSGIRVKHIDNPVMHQSNEVNSDFIAKTQESIHNLAIITGYLNYNSEFEKSVRLLNAAKRINRLKLGGFTRLSFRMFEPVVRFFLSKGISGLWLFDYFKLGLLYKVSPPQSNGGPE